jgi:hypothetical protein
MAVRGTYVSVGSAVSAFPYKNTPLQIYGRLNRYSTYNCEAMLVLYVETVVKDGNCSLRRPHPLFTLRLLSVIGVYFVPEGQIAQAQTVLQLITFRQKNK